jgi:acetolactate synthase-1/2/3 large subunit
LIDVPMDVFSQPLEAEPITVARRPNYGRAAADPHGIAAAAELLAGAAAPLIFAGNGATLSEASPELRELAELLSIPVATTLMAKGVFPEDHALSLGMTGIWGTRAANELARRADVILAVGTGFGEADCSSWNPQYTFAIPPSRVIQIDIDPEEIGKIYPVAVGLVGDAKATLRELVEVLRPRAPERSAERLEAIAAAKSDWQRELAAEQRNAGKPIHPARLLNEIARVAPADTIFATDVGWNKNGAGQQLVVRRPQAWITSGGMATMGFAPAAAIGAKIGAPDKPVVCLVGDGGFLSVVGALTTAVELGIPVVWVLFNNFCFSTIRTVGTTYFNSAYATEFTTPDGAPYNPDFVQLAGAFGIEAARVEEPDDLPAALSRALAAGVPYVLDVWTRGDVPMPRTGHWDIAEFLAAGND